MLEKTNEAGLRTDRFAVLTFDDQIEHPAALPHGLVASFKATGARLVPLRDA